MGLYRQSPPTHYQPRNEWVSSACLHTAPQTRQTHLDNFYRVELSSCHSFGCWPNAKDAKIQSFNLPGSNFWPIVQQWTRQRTAANKNYLIKRNPAPEDSSSNNRKSEDEASLRPTATPGAGRQPVPSRARGAGPLHTNTRYTTRISRFKHFKTLFVIYNQLALKQWKPTSTFFEGPWRWVQ